MAKWIFNNTNQVKSYIGQDIAAFGYYQIQPLEEVSWANNDQLLADIGAGLALVCTDNNSSSELGVSDGINHLKDLDPRVTIVEQPPFASKKTAEGKSLYVRDKGITFTLTAGANSGLQCNIDFPTMKFNGLEIIGGEAGDTVDLKILDTPTGTISTVPNYMLNQFGYTVGVAPSFYHRESRYDADLIQDMKIEIDYQSESAKTIIINYILHEVK